LTSKQFALDMSKLGQILPFHNTNVFFIIIISLVYFCGLFNDDFSFANYITSNGMMVDELERIWKEPVMV
jgi:hypothetical protein